MSQVWAGFVFKKEGIGLLKILTSFHKWLAAETHVADGEFLEVAVNREEFLKLRGRTRIPVISRREDQHFKPGQTEMKNSASRWSLLLCNAWRFRNLRKSTYVKWSQVKKTYWQRANNSNNNNNYNTNVNRGINMCVGHVEFMGKEKCIQVFGERIWRKYTACVT